MTNCTGLLAKIRFYRYFQQDRFAEALALMRASAPRTGWEQWASYRLGLYGTVAQTRWDGRHVRGGVAVAVSLAACGRMEAAAALAWQLAARADLGRYRVVLADALAPFAPELALGLIEAGPAPLGLRVGLLLRTGATAEAAQLIEEALAAGQTQQVPELFLLATNALGGSPGLQLERINAFLATSALAPLALLNAALPPNTANLVSAVALPSAHGPLVSVLMTAFDTVDRIAAAIAGLLAQTYRNIEVIVVDDASTDGTESVVRSMAAQDMRVKYFRLPCNVGTYVAKTVGLHHAAGEFVTCHDSDDWSHPLRIERQVKPLLINKDLVATTSQWVRMQDDGIFYARPVHPLMCVNPASPLFRRQEVLEKAGFWNLVRTGADSEFLTRLRLVFGRRAVHRIKQPLAFGAHRPNALMTATSTGYSAAGMSPVRLAYWEAWTHWHVAELRVGRRPVMPAGLLAARPFEVPAKISVAREDIAQCTDAFCLRY